MIIDARQLFVVIFAAIKPPLSIRFYSRIHQNYQRELIWAAWSSSWIGYTTVYFSAAWEAASPDSRLCTLPRAVTSEGRPCTQCCWSPLQHKHYKTTRLHLSYCQCIEARRTVKLFRGDHDLIIYYPRYTHLWKVFVVGRLVPQSLKHDRISMSW